MTNYTRSRALSNAVVDISVDQPLHVTDNLGRQSWDTPHRLLSWGYLPAWNPSWAFAYLLDVRSGIPFSVVRDTGEVVGAVNSQRFPTNFALNLHLERKFHVGRYRFAVRAGLNNVTNSANATGVNNVIDSPNFLQYYGKEGRHGVFRLASATAGRVSCFTSSVIQPPAPLKRVKRPIALKRQFWLRCLLCPDDYLATTMQEPVASRFPRLATGRLTSRSACTCSGVRRSGSVTPPRALARDTCRL